MINHSPNLLTVSELSKITRRSEYFLRKLIRRKVLPTAGNIKPYMMNCHEVLPKFGLKTPCNSNGKESYLASSKECGDCPYRRTYAT